MKVLSEYRGTPEEVRGRALAMDPAFLGRTECQWQQLVCDAIEVLHHDMATIILGDKRKRLNRKIRNAAIRHWPRGSFQLTVFEEPME